MHVPNPLGGVPLILRDANVSTPKNGELLFDYENDDLYYVNKETGIKKDIAEDIYQKIIATRLENPKFNVTRSGIEVEGEEEITPPVEDRKMNNWFLSIKSRSERSEPNDD